MTDALVRTRRPGWTATVVVALVFAVAGCGASASSVKSGPTTAAPTTAASTTTGGSGGTWPPGVEKQFLHELRGW